MTPAERQLARQLLRLEVHQRIDAQRNALLHACVVLCVCLLAVGAYRSAWVPLLAAVLVILGARVRKDRVLPAPAEAGVDGGGERRGEHPRRLPVNSSERESAR